MEWSAWITAAGAALAVLAKLGRVTLRGIRRMARMLDEVLGDGTEQRPGWGRRLAGIEGETRDLHTTVTGVDRRLARVEDTLSRAPVTLRTENSR